jgi:uncharacterized protein
MAIGECGAVGMDWACVLAGLGVGFIVGLTGVGGGALMTPLLVFLFGFAPTTAVGTDLLFATITKSVGTWVHGAQRTVDWLVMRPLACGSLPGALLTLATLRFYAGGGGSTDRLVLTALGWALLMTGLVTLLRNRLHRIGRRKRTETPQAFKRAQPALTVAAGAILGVLVTMTSVGAGALGAAMLVYLYPFRLTPVKIVGTDLAHAVPLTLVAGGGHLMMGNVDPRLLGLLLVGSIPGIYLGSHLSSRLPERLLRPALASLLVIVGARLLW